MLLLIINGHYMPFTLDSFLFMYSLHLEHILHHHFCKLGLYSFVFMHCIDLPLALNSHSCASEFFCFYAFYKFCSCSQQYIARPSSILLFLCISQINLSLSTVIIAHLRNTILMFLFIAWTLLSLSSAIDAHPNFILLF